MKNLRLGTSELNASEVSLGCMHLKELNIPAAEKLIDACLESGINFFDHADIYGDGICEEIFAKACHAPRESILLQSKCGIRKNVCFDFTKEHILTSVDGILKRLQTDYLDALLLHRPDALVEPEVVADAFDTLQSSGKVKNFGVSNFNPMQIELLKTCVKQPLIINQLQFSIMATGMIDAGINVNTKFDGSYDRDGSILDYCRIHKMTIQAWSPFQYGFFEGVFLDKVKFPKLNAVIDRLAKKYGVTDTAIAIAWILRHPAKMQPIIGTTNPTRVKDACKASDIQISHEEWYEIYLAAGNILP